MYVCIYTHIYKLHTYLCIYSCPSVSAGPAADTKIQGCSNSLYKLAQNFHITCMHTGYSRECLYITSFAWSQPSPWHVTNSSFDIWNFLKNFPPNNLDLQLIEPADMTPWIQRTNGIYFRNQEFTKISIALHPYSVLSFPLHFIFLCPSLHICLILEYI